METMEAAMGLLLQGGKGGDQNEAFFRKFQNDCYVLFP